MGTAGKIQRPPWEEILGLGAAVALQTLCELAVGGFPPHHRAPGQRGGPQPSSSTFWVVLKLPDKQELHCPLITLFGKNRAALALQRRGLSYLMLGEGSGLLLPSGGMCFPRALPHWWCPRGSWNLKHPYPSAFLPGSCSSLTSCTCQTPELYWGFRACLSSRTT